MSNHNSPDRMEDNRSWQSVGGNNFSSNQHQDIEEVSLRNIYSLKKINNFIQYYVIY